MFFLVVDVFSSSSPVPFLFVVVVFSYFLLLLYSFLWLLDKSTRFYVGVAEAGV